MDAFMGMISAFGFNFAPKNWMTCSGQTIGISQNSALFSLLGTTYGGNGTTTFMLPNLSGRVALGTGQLQGGGNYTWGEIAGTENVSLLIGQMPMHNHVLNASSGGATIDTPAGNLLAQAATPDGTAVNVYGPTSGAVMNAQAIGMAGNSAPHPNMQPYLALTYCICVYGIYPSRN